jgi:hypothetical protein
MYAAVPWSASLPSEAVAEVLLLADEPKSATFATHESESSTLPGLRSRWTTLLKCRYAKPLATSLAIERSEARHVRYSLYSAPPCSSSSSEISSSSSTIPTRCTLSVAMPSMSTTFGWRRPIIASCSRSMSASSCTEDSLSSRSCLTAQGVALNEHACTVPKVPSPSFSVILSSFQGMSLSLLARLACSTMSLSAAILAAPRGAAEAIGDATE